MRKILNKWLCFLLVLVVVCTGVGCREEEKEKPVVPTATPAVKETYREQKVEPYEVLNKNKPTFTKKEKNGKKSFEKYSKIDELGRCGVAFANIGKDLMPKKEREPIGMIKPSGWQTIKYDNVDGNYLYNRCHLIGFQLTGENANKRNLITGTRYFNTEGMLPFENRVAEYIKTTKNHVLYRVTPVYEDDNLVASGVQMEAYSVEDKGKGICFNVFVYNIQPGIAIDYRTGKSSLQDVTVQTEELVTKENCDYVVNKNTRRIHEKTCQSVADTLPKNRKYVKGTKEELIQKGYVPCGSCFAK